MAFDSRISRRRLMAGAGAAAAAAFSPLGPAAVFSPSMASAASGRLIPDGKLGTITFTQRDVPTRVGIAASAAMGVPPTMGYLGGPEFPQNPDDLGPLVPLPGGWLELFEFLAGCGFKQIEFAGYGQNAANPGGAAPNPAPGGVTTAESRAAYLAYARTLRGFLDAYGLQAIGNHGFIPNTWYGPNSPGGTMSSQDYDRLQTELEFAAILGMPYMGTGGDPTSANNRNIEPWTVAGEKWEALNRISLQWGIHMYTHNHSPAYNFLQDGPLVTVTEDRVSGAPIPPTVVRAESGKRLMQHYLDVTDPELVVIEMDIYWAHVAQHQWRWRYDYDGKRVEDIFDPTAQVAKQTMRYALFHAKDGDATGQPDGVGDGYTMIPFGDPRSDIDFTSFFGNIGAKGYHNPNYEQDNAPGGSADPGRSLRFAKISAGNMATLRG
ncbi:Xylose isomerase-like TIM barrel [Micromonospora rhizosphaerae]|uniref:Xylose isomerase-like TIM barrel n=1 Tax=Micromonospora rhizosphaerae TaxID=568872 RepID=A0A1C6SZR8_9ACTN|nr:TIM barrel protein [Micromonospora rhizosphaerae]SCL34889.1 Xylose isomerase-like TIM barrel [Micromonospora rhizosphaerae]